jgi:hypothetical protein
MKELEDMKKENFDLKNALRRYRIIVNDLTAKMNSNKKTFETYSLWITFQRS